VAAAVDGVFWVLVGLATATLLAALAILYAGPGRHASPDRPPDGERGAGSDR
jgi:hypothetical protein